MQITATRAAILINPMSITGGGVVKSSFMGATVVNELICDIKKPAFRQGHHVL
jgi:hypothetical protein